MNRLSPWQAWAWPAFPVALIYSAHLWYGASASFAAIALSGAEALLFLAFLSQRTFRTAFCRTKALPVISGLFAAVIAVSVWSFVPLAPGGTDPIWSYVTAIPAVTIDRSATIIELLKLAGLACVFGVGTMLGGNGQLIGPARKIIIYGGAAFCLWALIFLMSGAQLIGGHRLEGAFGSANSAATVIGSLLVLGLSLLRWRAPGTRPSGNVSSALLVNAPIVAVLMLFGGCLILTASRGGIFSTSIGIAILLLLLATSGRIQWRGALLAGLGIVMTGGLLLVAKGGVLVERMGSLPIGGGSRSDIYWAHWEAFLRSPILGYGLGSFADVNRLIITSGNYGSLWQVRDLHNLYLQWPEEGGLVGAVPIFSCIATIIFLVFRGLKGRRRDTTWIRAMLAVDALVLCHGLTDFALQVPSIAAFWSLLLGMQFGAAPSQGRSVQP